MDMNGSKAEMPIGKLVEHLLGLVSDTDHFLSKSIPNPNIIPRESMAVSFNFMKMI